MSDDPARQAEIDESVGGANAQPLAQSFVQITEVETGPVGAAQALERRDPYGRVPLIARIEAQAPIRVELVLIAVGLFAAGALPLLADALRAIIILIAVVTLFVGIVTRVFIRIPPRSVGIVLRGGRPGGELVEGVHTVNPVTVRLTHLVSLRQLAFDVPVTQVRSADGVGVTVDVLLTLAVADAAQLVYSSSTGDLDQVVHATCQDAVRKLIRDTDALATLDLGAAEADRLRAAIEERLGTFGLSVSAVAFTSVMLPAELTASLEARRLAAVKLDEQVEQAVLDQRRIADQARLEAEEQEGRRAAVEKAAEVEELRLAKLDARLAAYPAAAQYDLQLARLRVAEKAAGNTRAIVSLGGADTGSNLMLVPELEAAQVAVAGVGAQGSASPNPPATPGSGEGAAPAPARSRRGPA